MISLSRCSKKKSLLLSFQNEKSMGKQKYLINLKKKKFDFCFIAEVTLTV